MIKREIEETIKNINETFKVLLVTGPRQVGKTTVLKKMMEEDMEYISLDDEVLRKHANENPKGFLEEHPGRLFIDEVQYAPNLFPYIKMKVDESDKMGQYWLSGSQAFHLMKNITESLAGRVGIIKLNSFTYSEIIENYEKEIFKPGKYKKAEYININDLYERIFNGGMPEFIKREGINREVFFESYIKTYIERDIRELENIGNELDFRKFMVAVASRTGEQLNYSNISKEIGVSDKTIRNWISILVNTGVIYLLEPYRSTKIKRLTHMPKIIFMDTGLCAYLEGWENARELQLNSKAGHYLETYIISEIVKSYNSKGVRLDISYYRDKEKNEIDLIFKKNRMLYPFEIKKTSNPTKEMIKNFDRLEGKDFEVGSGGIICTYDKLLSFTDKHYIIPVSSVINSK